MREKNYSTRRQSPGLAAFLVGGLVGGIVALLYAPRSGKETREVLMTEGQHTADKMMQSVRDATENILARLESGQSRVEMMNRETRQRLREFERTAEQMVEEDRRNIGLSAADPNDLVSD